jgi:hypothetical protein
MRREYQTERSINCHKMCIKEKKKWKKEAGMQEKQQDRVRKRRNWVIEPGRAHSFGDQYQRERETKMYSYTRKENELGNLGTTKAIVKWYATAHQDTTGNVSREGSTLLAR